jgi:hypothetical protein
VATDISPEIRMYGPEVNLGNQREERERDLVPQYERQEGLIRMSAMGGVSPAAVFNHVRCIRMCGSDCPGNG